MNSLAYDLFFVGFILCLVVVLCGVMYYRIQQIRREGFKKRYIPQFICVAFVIFITPFHLKSSVLRIIDALLKLIP